MKNKYWIIFIFIMFCMNLPLKAYAATNIALDGNFCDWSDKPYLVDKAGDETPSQDLVLVKWFPDTSSGNLYFYAERLSGKDDSKHKSFEDWVLNLYIEGELGQRRITVDFHPPSSFVDITLYDNKGNYLWSEKGKWGDDKEPGTRIEFMVPFEDIVSSITSGYQLSAYFVSGTDRVPDNGIISISTISTFAVGNLLGVVIICLALYLVITRRVQKSGLNKKEIQL